jgi:tetratricopeptide (TPR) repeat protein
MESEVGQLASLLKLWAWLETNKKQVMWGGGIVVVLGLVIWFLVLQHREKEIKAGEALSEVFVKQALAGGAAGPETAQGYLKVAAMYPGFDAGAQAMLLAGGSLFAGGNYDAAKAEFERFVRQYRASPLRSQALLGIAACLDAQHKASEAMTAYNSLIGQHPNDPVTPQAKFALARLYEAQNKPELARNLFEDVARSRNTLVGSEAGIRLEELYQAHPNLAPPLVTPAPTATAPANLLANAPTNVPTNALTNARPNALTNAPAKSEKK